MVPITMETIMENMTGIMIDYSAVQRGYAKKQYLISKKVYPQMDNVNQEGKR